jgi:hypothetical protein
VVPSGRSFLCSLTVALTSRSGEGVAPEEPTRACRKPCISKGFCLPHCEGVYLFCVPLPIAGGAVRAFRLGPAPSPDGQDHLPSPGASTPWQQRASAVSGAETMWEPVLHRLPR